MWVLLALAAALFQVLRNTAMKRLGHALNEYINVRGRFTFLLPFALASCLLGGWPAVRSGFFTWCAVFGVSQTISTLTLSKALKTSEISLVTALWKVSLIILLGMAYVSIGERPSALGVTGVVLSAVGVYLLNVRRARISAWEPIIVLVADRGQPLDAGGGVLLRALRDHHEASDRDLQSGHRDAGWLRGRHP